jgi:hypothetical protein
MRVTDAQDRAAGIGGHSCELRWVGQIAKGWDEFDLGTSELNPVAGLRCFCGALGQKVNGVSIVSVVNCNRAEDLKAASHGGRRAAS